MQEATEVDPARTFVEHIRLIVEQRGLSQLELSRRAGLGRTTIRRLLKGEQTVTVEHVWALSRALDVPVVDLLPIDSAGLSPAESEVVEALRAADSGRLRVALDAFPGIVFETPPGDPAEDRHVVSTARQLRHSATTIEAAAASIRNAANVLDPRADDSLPGVSSHHLAVLVDAAKRVLAEQAEDEATDQDLREAVERFTTAPPE